MKAIDNASKMDVRIELMQVVQKYSRNRPTESTSSYCQTLQSVQYPPFIPALNTVHDPGLNAPENSVIPCSSNNWSPHY